MIGPDRPPYLRERVGGPVTRRRSQVQHSTTDQRLLDSRGPSDWVHTDPWRVLRIQAEFVEGFGALAELGPAVTRVRLGPHPARPPRVRARPSELGARAGRGRLRGDHRRRPGLDGGGQQGRLRGRRRVGRARHRAALRAGPQRLGRPRHQLPLLLRPQDDVRQVRPGLRRACPAASAPSTSCSRRSPWCRPARSPRSRSCCFGTDYWQRPARLDARHRARRRARSARPTSTCCTLTDDVDEAVADRRAPRGDHDARPIEARADADGWHGTAQRVSPSVPAVCVFCASSERHRRRATSSSPRGRPRGSPARGWALVTGGGSVSMMGAVARRRPGRRRRTPSASSRAALVARRGRRRRRRRAASSPTTCASARRRWTRRADAFLALPGGIGTLEELFEIWVAGSLGMHDKPVVVLDPWRRPGDRLRALVDGLVAGGFVRDVAARPGGVDDHGRRRGRRRGGGLGAARAAQAAVDRGRGRAASSPSPRPARQARPRRATAGGRGGRRSTRPCRASAGSRARRAPGTPGRRATPTTAVAASVPTSRSAEPAGRGSRRRSPCWTATPAPASRSRPARRAGG